MTIQTNSANLLMVGFCSSFVSLHRMNDDELSYLPEWSYHSITSFIAGFNFDRIHRNKF